MKARSRVEIDDALTVWQLKDAVKGKKPDTPKWEADKLQLFLAEKNGEWLKDDRSWILKNVQWLSLDRWRLPMEICACPMYLQSVFVQCWQSSHCSRLWLVVCSLQQVW
jgi:hypothetical protein